MENFIQQTDSLIEELETLFTYFFLILKRWFVVKLLFNKFHIGEN
jgi:hypothetical protein